MTREESKLAYDRRVKRRQAASISENTVSGGVDQPMSTSRAVRTFYRTNSQGAADSRAGGQLIPTMHGSEDHSRLTCMLPGDRSAQGRPVNNNSIV